MQKYKNQNRQRYIQTLLESGMYSTSLQQTLGINEQVSKHYISDVLTNVANYYNNHSKEEAFIRSCTEIFNKHGVVFLPRETQLNNKIQDQLYTDSLSNSGSSLPIYLQYTHKISHFPESYLGKPGSVERQCLTSTLLDKAHPAPRNDGSSVFQKPIQHSASEGNLTKHHIMTRAVSIDGLSESIRTSHIDKPTQVSQICSI